MTASTPERMVANPRRTRLHATPAGGTRRGRVTPAADETIISTADIESFLAEHGEMSPLIRMMIDYFIARGRPVPTSTTGAKVVEEAGELREALAEDDEQHAMEELADVFISASAVAFRRGWTPEACIALKTAKDTGREARTQAEKAAKAARKAARKDGQSESVA